MSSAYSYCNEGWAIYLFVFYQNYNTCCATTLAASMDEIEYLWWHPGVQRLVKAHKLKLEEYAALCVAEFVPCFSS